MKGERRKDWVTEASRKQKWTARIRKEERKDRTKVSQQNRRNAVKRTKTGWRKQQTSGFCWNVYMKKEKSKGESLRDISTRKSDNQITSFIASLGQFVRLLKWEGRRLVTQSEGNFVLLMMVLRQVQQLQSLEWKLDRVFCLLVLLLHVDLLRFSQDNLFL